MARILVDTNVLLRSIDPAHSAFHLAVDSQISLRSAGHSLCIVDQNVVEFRAVATRPLSANGLGMSGPEVAQEIARLKSLYFQSSDTPTVFAEWERLVNAYGAEGKQNHDARIAAAMVVHEIDSILTFNESDFVRYQEIRTLTPAKVLTAN